MRRILFTFWQRFLSSNGGLTGGWDEYDHGTFLRYRLQYKVLLCTIKSCLSAMFLTTFS